MKPAAFELALPASLDAALELLARHCGSARPLAGGQTLVPVMNLRLATPEWLIDLNGIAELAGIGVDDQHLRIGAMTRQAELLSDARVRSHAPLLAQAARYIGHVQTRARGTVGGSLAHADPAAELPLVMVALDAVIQVASARGIRAIPARQFFQHALVTALASDELITAVEVPIAPAGARAAFRELSRRHGDFALVAVAVQRDGTRLSAAVGGLEGTPRYCAELVAALAGRDLHGSDIKGLVSAALAGATALDDFHASGPYRRHLATVLLCDALRELA